MSALASLWQQLTKPLGSFEPGEAEAAAQERAGPHPYAPPPFLLGVTFLYWGYAHSLLWVAIPAAFLVEFAAHADWRWNLSETDFVRVWNASMILTLVVLASNLAGGGLEETFSVAMRWIPIMFLPFFLSQLYSVRGELPLNTVAVLARRRRRLDRNAGRRLEPAHMVHLGYPFVALLLLSAGAVRLPLFLPAVVVATLVALALNQRDRPRSHPTLYAAALLAVLGFTFVGASTIRRLGAILNGNRFNHTAAHQQAPDARWSHTAIGQIGEIKLSDHIHWLMTVEEGQKADYLRETSYVEYNKGTWKNPALNNFGLAPGETPDWQLGGRDTNARLRLRGRPPAVISILPIPYTPDRIEGLQAELVRTNLLASVQGDAMRGVVDFSVTHRANEISDPGPMPRDLFLHRNAPEAPVLADLATRIWSQSDTPRQRVEAIAAFFADDFEYTTYLRAPASRKEAIGYFLTETKSGHCEYFATASVLLLRTAGIPARYCVGYSIGEYSERLESHVVRGRHRHAWCEAWVDGQWEVVENTPPVWMMAEAPDESAWRSFLDAWQARRFALSAWWQSPWGTRMVKITTWVTGGILILYVLLRTFVGKRGRSAGGDADAATGWPGLDSEFLELVERLAEQPAPTEPAFQQAYATARRLHQRYRFDPAGIAEAEREELRLTSKTCLKMLQADIKEMDPRPSLKA